MPAISARTSAILENATRNFRLRYCTAVLERTLTSSKCCCRRCRKLETRLLRALRRCCRLIAARASLRIQGRVLGIKVVKTALRNYFKNRQGLITEDTYRQFAARYKFFYQQFVVVLCRLF